MYVNKAMVYGNLTVTPELQTLPSGTLVTNFGLATNNNYKDRDGNKQTETEFHNIVVFGKSAELVTKYLQKGSSAFIEGRLQTRSWDKDGTTRYRTEIVASSVQFGPKGAPKTEPVVEPETKVETPEPESTDGGSEEKKVDLIDS